MFISQNLPILTASIASPSFCGARFRGPRMESTWPAQGWKASCSSCGKRRWWDGAIGKGAGSMGKRCWIYICIYIRTMVQPETAWNLLFSHVLLVSIKIWICRICIHIPIKLTLAKFTVESLWNLGGRMLFLSNKLLGMFWMSCIPPLHQVHVLPF